MAPDVRISLIAQGRQWAAYPSVGEFVEFITTPGGAVEYCPDCVGDSCQAEFKGEIRNRARAQGLFDFDARMGAIPVGVLYGVPFGMTADSQQSPSDVALRLEVVQLKDRLSSLASANAYAGELLAELEDTRQIIESRNGQLEQQQIELERALKTAESANAAKQAQSQFLANMSHEMRTPLSGIVGMCRMLMEGDLIGEQLSFAETIQTSAGCLLELVNDLLDLAKIESGQLVLESVTFSPGDIVEAAMEMVAERAHAKDLEFVASPLLQLPETCIGDPTRLRQILLNLLSNAVKFTDLGHVILGAQLLSDDDTSTLIRFSITDTGIGISSAQLPRLFRAFAQADASTSRRFGGTGLGLAIAHRLVGFMGGEIGVESVPGQGSNFWFTVRLGKTALACPATPDRKLPAMSVFIVEGKSFSRSTISQYLCAWGLCPVEYTDVGSAIGGVRLRGGTSHTAVLLDETMTRASDLVSMIRREYPDWKIILLKSPGAVSSTPQLGTVGDGFLRKPVHAASLFQMMWRVGTNSTENAQSKTSDSAARTPPSRTMIDAGERRLSGHALVVEDNPVNQRIAVHALRRLGMLVDAAANGQEALDAVSRTRFDLIFMDCQMPGMDGYEVTRHLRNLEVERRTPIIALTAHAMQGDRDRCLEAGMDDYLTKPFDLRSLENIAERWIGIREDPPRPFPASQKTGHES
jgi:two-component system sensor histidine kinase/response regulator